MQKLSYELVQDQKKSKFDIGLSQKFFWTGIAGFAYFYEVRQIFWIWLWTGKNKSKQKDFAMCVAVSKS